MHECRGAAGVERVCGQGFPFLFNTIGLSSILVASDTLKLG